MCRTVECVLCGVHHDSHSAFITHYLENHCIRSCTAVVKECYIEHYDSQATDRCRKCNAYIIPTITQHTQCRGVLPNGCEWCKTMFANQELRLEHELDCDQRPPQRKWVAVNLVDPDPIKRTRSISFLLYVLQDQGWMTIADVAKMTNINVTMIRHEAEECPAIYEMDEAKTKIRAL